MKKILILEDDPDIGDILEMALSGRYITLVKRTENDLQNDIDSFRPDLLIIDNQIGQTNAGNIISDIKAGYSYKPIPFILFSAHADIKLLAQKLGAKAYLPKPFKLDEIYQCVENVLSNFND